MLVLIALCGSDGSAVTVARGTNAGLSEPGGKGALLLPPLIFGRSVHTISSRGADYIRPSHCYLPPEFSDLPTALQCNVHPVSVWFFSRKITSQLIIFLCIS